MLKVANRDVAFYLRRAAVCGPSEDGTDGELE
jgi:hypothetical protein